MASGREVLWADMSDDSDDEQNRGGPRNLIHRQRLEREAAAAKQAVVSSSTYHPPSGGRGNHAPPPRRQNNDRKPPRNRYERPDSRHQDYDHHRRGGDHHDSSRHYPGGGPPVKPHNILSKRPQNSRLNTPAPLPTPPATTAAPAPTSAKPATNAEAAKVKPKLHLGSIMNDLNGNESARNPSIFGEGKPREDVLHHDKKEATATSDEPPAPAEHSRKPKGPREPKEPKETKEVKEVKEAAKEAPTEGPKVHAKDTAKESQPSETPRSATQAPPAPKDEGSHPPPPPPPPPPAASVPLDPISNGIPLADPVVAAAQPFNPLVSGSRPGATYYSNEFPPPEMLYAPAMYRQPQYGFPMCYLPPTGAMPTAERIFIDPMGRPAEAIVPPYMETEQAQNYRHRHPQVYSATVPPGHMRSPCPMFVNPGDRFVHAPPAPTAEPSAVALAEPPREVVTFVRNKNIVNRRPLQPPPPPPPPPPAAPASSNASPSGVPPPPPPPQSSTAAEKKTWAAIASASKN